MISKGLPSVLPIILGGWKFPPWERYDFVLGLGKREGKSEGYSREFEGKFIELDVI